MTLSVLSAVPTMTLPVFARLYGSSEADFAGSVNQLSAAWQVHNVAGDILGVLGLRPSPAHGAEILGGVFAGEQRRDAALALLWAARAAQPQLYAYAEAHLFPAETLAAAGLHVVSAYTRLTGSLPTMLPDVPDGFSIVPLTEVSDLADRRAAQQTYSDLIGHTHITPESLQPNVGGSDDRLGRLAYDAAGAPAGLCRAWLNGETASLGAPGVRLELRGSGLRRALLLSVCQALAEVGAERITLDAWGDTEAQRTGDLALGLVLEELTPIYASA